MLRFKDFSVDIETKIAIEDIMAVMSFENKMVTITNYDSLWFECDIDTYAEWVANKSVELVDNIIHELRLDGITNTCDSLKENVKNDIKNINTESLLMTAAHILNIAKGTKYAGAAYYLSIALHI